MLNCNRSTGLLRGKKLKAINNLSHAMDIQEIGKKASAYFFQKPEVKVVYLFGSMAKRKENKSSDIDIAVLLDENFAAQEISYTYRPTVITDLIGVLKTEKLDLIILNESPLLLCFRTVQEGLILYSSDETQRVRFETRIMSRYFDQQYYFKRHAKITIDQIASEGIL